MKDQHWIIWTLLSALLVAFVLSDILVGEVTGDTWLCAIGSVITGLGATLELRDRRG